MGLNYFGSMHPVVVRVLLNFVARTLRQRNAREIKGLCAGFLWVAFLMCVPNFWRRATGYFVLRGRARYCLISSVDALALTKLVRVLLGCVGFVLEEETE